MNPHLIEVWLLTEMRPKTVLSGVDTILGGHLCWGQPYATTLRFYDHKREVVKTARQLDRCNIRCRACELRARRGGNHRASDVEERAAARALAARNDADHYNLEVVRRVMFGPTQSFLAIERANHSFELARGREFALIRDLVYSTECVWTFVYRYAHLFVNEPVEVTRATV